MNVCLSFIGLQRTLEKTVQKLKDSLLSDKHNYFIVYVTWENEDTQIFSNHFPGSLIVKVPCIDSSNSLFQNWKKDLQMHVSWRRTYHDNDVALFRYFLQIYLWILASLFLKSLPQFSSFDVLVRMRTDIVIDGPPLHSFYSMVLMNEKKFVFFPNSPRHSIQKEGEGCPDYLFFGSPQAVCSCLEIIQHVHKYKVTYIEDRTRWYNTPVKEENILQPESTLYAMVVGEGLVPFFLPLSVEVCR